MKPWIFSVITFALVACSSAPSPETKTAISALKGLNSKLDVGINMVGYAEALRETKVAVDQAIEAEPKSKNTQVIKKVMDGHLAALQLWRCNLESTRYDTDAPDKCRNTVYETLIFPSYPELQKKVEQEKSTYSSGTYIYNVNHDAVLQILWQQAESDLNSLESK